MRLKELRQQLNISAKQVSKDLDIPYTTYLNYEKETREPCLRMLDKLADYFNVSTDYLLGKTKKRQAPEGLTAKDLDTLERIKYLQEHSPEDYALVKSLIEKLANKQ